MYMNNILVHLVPFQAIFKKFWTNMVICYEQLLEYQMDT